MLNVRIQHDPQSQAWLALSADQLDLPAPAPLDLLQDYNELLGRCVAESPSVRSYLSSQVLNRTEAQTGLFNLLCQYLHLCEVLQKAARDRQNIHIQTDEPVLWAALLRMATRQGWPTQKRARSRLLRQQIRRWVVGSLRMVAMAGFDIAHWCVARATQRGISDTAQCAVISFFDHRSCGPNGRYVDPYFEPLLESMRGQKRPYCVIANIMHSGKWWRSFGRQRQISTMQQQDDIVSVYRLLRIRDLVGVYWRSFRTPNKCRQAMILAGRDIRPLLNAAMSAELASNGTRYFANKYIGVAKALCAQLKIKTVLYPFENHSWEKLLIMTARTRRPDLRFVGYQHTSFSLKLLNHFPTQAEQQLQIFPDTLFTVGEMPRRALEEYGHFPQGVLQAACALRHGYLFAESTSQTPNSTAKHRRVAFAFSSDLSTYDRIVDVLRKAFAGLSVEVLLKSHPLIGSDAEVFSDLPDYMKVSTVGWAELFQQIDVLYYHDNSLGIESMYHGVSSCYLGVCDDSYDCHRLYFAPNAEAGAVRTESALRAQLEAYYLTETSSSIGLCADSEYLTQYFAPITNACMDHMIREVYGDESQKTNSAA